MHPGLLFRPVVLRVLLCAGGLGAAGLRMEAAQKPGAVDAGAFEPSAVQLKRLASATDAELWLAREIPQGLTLAEAPDFFGAADEVFFNAEENLYVYAYRSAVTGRWIAWVAFDADRTAVVHTAAVELDR